MQLNRALEYFACVISSSAVLTGILALPSTADGENEVINNPKQFELRAPINSPPPAAESKPGSDIYRATAPFNKDLQKSIERGDYSGKAPDTKEKLTSVVGANASMVIQPDKDIQLGPLQGLVVQVQNSTDRPLLFDGDKATATLAGSTMNAASLNQIYAAASPPKTSGQRFKHATRASIIAGATIGTIPTAWDIKTQAGPIPQRYGGDEGRRVAEQSRFGKRLLWPGDTTTGALYFQSENSLKGAAIDLPVSSMFDSTDSSSIKQVR